MTTLTDKEREEFLKTLKEVKKRVQHDGEYARQLLIGAGIFTKKGKLRKPYRNLHYFLCTRREPD